MVMKVTFEAMTARDLFKQLADFIEVGAGTPEASKPVTKSPARQAVEAATATLPEPPKPVSVQAAEQAEEQVAEVLKPPTPAVMALLNKLGVPKSEWDYIARTGADARMTQRDVKKYVADKASASEETSETPEVTEEPKTSEVKEVDEQELRNVLRELYQAENGRDRCFSLLKQYGTTSIPEINPEYYSAIYAAVKEELSIS